MQSQKVARTSRRAIPVSMIDRDLEESKLLEIWAKADSARAFEDTDWESSEDLTDLGSIECPRDGYFS